MKLFFMDIGQNVIRTGPNTLALCLMLDFSFAKPVYIMQHARNEANEGGSTERGDKADQRNELFVVAFGPQVGFFRLKAYSLGI